LDGLTSDAFVRAGGSSVSHFNCPGWAMHPSLPDDAWTVDKSGIHLTKDHVGYFNCPVHLPDGATVSAFRAAVRDNSTVGQVVCYMQAWSVAWPNDGYALAFTNYSGDATTPGDTMLLDDSIKDPVVDNSKWSYMAECELTGANQSITLRAVSIEYQVGAVVGY